jgi:hypothetical protein
MHHPKICGLIHDSNGGHTSACGANNSIRQYPTRRTPSMPATNRKRDYNLNNQHFQQHQQKQSRLTRSKSVPYCPNYTIKSVSNSKKNTYQQVQQQPQQQHQQQYTVNQQTQQNLNKQYHQHNNDIGTKLTNSIDNLEWNELLRMLQEEYTKLVL